MPVNLIKSVWEAGVLRFRNCFTNTPIFTVGSVRRHDYLVASDIDTQNGTLTAAIVAGGLVVHTSNTGAGTLTTDTAANIIAAFPGIAAGDTVTAYVINDGNQTVTIAAGDGDVTLANAAQTIATNEAAVLLFLVTSATTVTVYIIGA
jgi:hypothetical protein